MKRILVCCLVVLMAACKKDSNDVAPIEDFSNNFVGDYWTKTVAADGSLSTDQTWKVTRLDLNKLSIDYTITYSFKQIEKKVVQKYKLDEVSAINFETIKISELAEFTEDEGAVKTKKVEAEGVKTTDLTGLVKIGTTFKISEADNSNPVTFEYLEFKKK